MTNQPSASNESFPMLVDPAWLHERLGQPNLVIVDARPSDEYGTEHIPGAISWDTFLKYHWADTSADGMETFIRLSERTIRAAGISPDSEVVVYESNAGYRAARALWLLRWLGHEQAAMLDGGLNAWKQAGYATTTEPRAASQGSFRAQPAPEEAGTVDDVLRLMQASDGLVLDVRSPEEYTGANRRAIRGGHVPGAINLDWVKNLDAAGKFKPLDELKQMYEAAGVTPDREIVTYCHGAYRAAHTWIALKMLGYPRVRTYVGSWQEWGDRIDLPIREGAEP